MLDFLARLLELRLRFRRNPGARAYVNQALANLAKAIADNPDDEAIDREVTRLAEDLTLRFGAKLKGPPGSGVVRPVTLHVPAKRYFCRTDAGHPDNLSAASRQSLRVPGGPCQLPRCGNSRAQPISTSRFGVRRWDERGRIEGAAIRHFRDYGDLLDRLRLARG